MDRLAEQVLTNTIQLSILALQLVHFLKNTLAVNKITRNAISGWCARSGGREYRHTKHVAHAQSTYWRKVNVNDYNA